MQTMLKTPILSDPQIAQFKDDGFVIKQGAFSADQIALISGWSDEMLARPEQSGQHWVYHEKSLDAENRDLVARIEKLSPFHNGFLELSNVLKSSVAQLMDEDAILFKEKINFKMPGGAGFTPHQDSQAGWDAYADLFISVLVCIDESTVENGCLEMVRGFHNKGLYASWQPLNDDDMKDMVFEQFPTNPGDVVYFDCYAPHKSAANMTGTTRRIYFATYNRAAAGDYQDVYYADKFKNYPPDIDREAHKNYVFRV